MTRDDSARARRFRQAAIVYLHYAVLYWVGARVLIDHGLVPVSRGPVWIWLVAGGAIGIAITAALWWWHNVWFARVVWILVALRLPALVEGAFVAPTPGIPPDLYLVAGIAVVINLAFLARAAWDL